MEDLLPIELVEYIHKFNRQPQPKELQNDIINFHEAKKLMIALYQGDLDLLINDLIGYLNNFLPLMYGYDETFVKRVKNIDMFITNVLYTFSEDKALNALLSVLKPYERLDFCKKNSLLMI
jgi:hypothetical protein